MCTGENIVELNCKQNKDTTIAFLVSLLQKKKTHQRIEQLVKVNTNNANIQKRVRILTKEKRTSTDIPKWFRISANGSIFL